MEENKKTVGNKRNQVNKDGKIVKSVGSVLITGVLATGVTALTMLKPKTLFAIGPFVLAKKAGKIAIPKLIASGGVAATIAGASSLIAHKKGNPSEKTALLPNKEINNE